MKIGIDIGGSHIGIGLINEENQIVKKIERDVTYSGDVAKKVIAYLEENIDNLRKETNIELIGIATPGNMKGSTATNLVNLGLAKLDLSYILEKYSDIPIQTRNDAKAAGLAENKYGALKEYKDSVFLCMGTGIGSAVFMNKNLLVANKNTGFELGHMIINKGGLKCNCGKDGCFETYCSIKRFKENIKEELEIDYCSSEELLEIIKNEINNLRIKRIIDEYIENMIVGLSNIIDIFEPEAICLGGSFVFFKDILYDKLVSEMNSKKYVFNKDSMPKIILATLKNDAGIIGAAL